MPAWNELLAEATKTGGTHDVIRRQYLKKLADLTGRNVIIYYSGWLQKDSPQLRNAMSVNDSDKNGFMTAIHKLDRTRGLDLVLHTPGGDAAATESLVYYLRAMFGVNIRAIVPQLAMSAGTMIACACREIVMGKHSSLGPIDPQIGGVPAHGIVEEWNRAVAEGQANQFTIPFWQRVIDKYHPTLLSNCERAIAWSEEMVTDWLKTGMLAGDADLDTKVVRILEELGHALPKTHNRHLSIEKARDIGLNVVALEDNDDLQEAVLSVHHACIHTLTMTPAVKIIENHDGVAFIQLAQPVATLVAG